MIGNPADFKTAQALTVSQIDVRIDLASLTKDVIVIRRIAIIVPDISYEMSGSMPNFDAIQKNIASYLAPAGNNKEKGGTKLIVEELSSRQVKARASAALMGDKTVSLALPDITLKNLGKAKGGITPGELGQEVAKALTAKLGSAVSVDGLLKSADGASGKAGTAINGLFK